MPSLKAISAKTACDVMYVPFCQLFLSELNVRKDGSEEGIPELADSILADGVLQNLVGYDEPEKDSKTIRKGVACGGRRWRALAHLVKQKKIDQSYPVPFKVVSKGQAIVLSLAENNYRQPLHPADEFLAAKALLDEGKSIEDIAARLRLQPIVVQRRLELAHVAPEFIEAYRKSDLTLEHLMAFAVTRDQAKQREAWEGLPAYQRTPRGIRNLLAAALIPASDPIARFVTVKTYEQAGGQTRRELFDEDDDLLLCDRALLTELARKKLQKKAAPLGKESLAWIDVCPVVVDQALLATYGRVNTAKRDMTPEEQERMKEIEAELDEIDEEEQKAFDGEDEPEPTVMADLEKRRDELEQVRETILCALQIPVPDQVAKSGALICIDHDGKVLVRRGLLRAEDAKLFAQQARREVKPELEGQKAEKPRHSAALMMRLTQQRTLALRAEYVQHPEVALAAVVDRFVHNTLHLFQRNSGNALEIVSPERYLDTGAAEEQGSAAAFLKERREAWSDRIRKADDQFQFILSLPMAEKLDLLAVCTAATLDAVQHREGPSEADPLATALQLDLRRWWTPSAANYFESVSKEVILDALRDRNVPQDKLTRLKALSRKELAREAEKLLEGQGWLPAFLRSVEPDRPNTDGAKAA